MLPMLHSLGARTQGQEYFSQFIASEGSVYWQLVSCAWAVVPCGGRQLFTSSRQETVKTQGGARDNRLE